MGIVAVAINSALAIPSALAAGLPRAEGDDFRLQLSHAMTRDSNLYRLPDGIDASTLSPNSGATRDDVVSRTSVAVDGGWEQGLQTFALNATLDDNRYSDNDSLDNTSGNGRLDWNWRMGRDWSGQLGGGYGRSLSGFVNSRFLGRDVLESTDRHGALRYQLTPHWSLSAKARLAEGSHDTIARQIDDFESNSRTFSLDYVTGRGNTFGLEYRRTGTSFPNERPPSDLILTPLFQSRRYIDREANLNARYAFTVKTSLQGSVGYVWRHYPQGVLGDFAGATWNAALLWEPRAKLRVTVSQWQELTAYLDVESSYFRSRGNRLTVAWLPSSRLTLAVDVSDERHDYEGFDPGAFAEGDPRRDSLQSARASLTWNPRQMLAFDVSWGLERRDSNRPLFDFDDRTASVGLRLIF